MSAVSANRSAVVRQRPLLLSRNAFLATFAIVALAAVGWKYIHLPASKSAVLSQATATVSIHSLTFPYQLAWQEALGQNKSDIGDRLSIEGRRAGDVTVVAISLSDSPRETDSSLVNNIAAAYARTCRSRWTVEAERVCASAQEELRDAQVAAQQANARLELLRRRQGEASSEKLRSEAAASVENPQWVEAARRLAQLEERRRVLLFERTPLHPSVQEVEAHIGDVRRELAAIPPKIAQTPAVGSSANIPSSHASISATPVLAEIRAAEQSAESASRQLTQCEAAARVAMAARGDELRVDIEPASSLGPAAAAPQLTSAHWGAAVAAAATSVIGLAMISLGASLEPAIETIGELQSALPVAVVGVLPTVHPSRPASRSSLRRRLMRYAAIVLGVLMLVAVTWLLLGI